MIDMKTIRKILTGSLACMIMVMVIGSQAALAASSHQEMNGLPEPAGVTKVDAAEGIVRIQTGTQEDGKFTAEKSFSGFIVGSNGTNGVYIVTTWHSVGKNPETIVKVIVKNDSAVEGTVVAYSKEQDFCIIAADSMKGKTPLPMRIMDYDEDDQLSGGSQVSALGFLAEAAAGTEFSAADVTERKGKITEADFDNNSVDYIKHNIDVTGGLDGGPLVDENGYVIGLNNSKIKPEDGDCCSLDIREVDKLLDSNDIAHRTKDKDALYGELYNLCDQSIGMYKKIKKSDRGDMYDAIQKAIKVMGETPYDRAALNSAYDGLKKASETAELKTPKSLILICVLGGVIVALLARLISLIVWNRKYDKENGGAPAKAKPEKRKERGKKANKKPERVTGAALSTADTARPTGNVLIVRRTGAVYEINKNIVTMGRSPEADVTIEDNVYVARMHALIDNKKGVFFLNDMGTANGTYLNGQKIPDTGIRLVPGDIIGLGNEEIEFR